MPKLHKCTTQNHRFNLKLNGHELPKNMMVVLFLNDFTLEEKIPVSHSRSADTLSSDIRKRIKIKNQCLPCCISLTNIKSQTLRTWNLLLHLSICETAKKKKKMATLFVHFPILTRQTCLSWAYHWVFDCVHQSDNVGPSSQVLQDLDLSLDLLLLDRLIPQGNQAKQTKTINEKRGLGVTINRYIKSGHVKAAILSPRCLFQLWSGTSWSGLTCCCNSSALACQSVTFRAQVRWRFTSNRHPHL